MNEDKDMKGQITEENIPSTDQTQTTADNNSSTVQTKADKKQAAAQKKAEKKQQNREILAAWKAEKKAKKQLRRERLKARPIWWKLLSGLGLAAIVIAAAAGIFYLAGGINLIANMILKYYTDNIYAVESMDTEEIRKDVVIDQDAADKVAAMPEYGSDDTWAIYVYMVGSNLESEGENDLSDMVNEISSQVSAELDEAYDQTSDDNMAMYLSALDEAGMELPSPMYVATRPEASTSVPVTEDTVRAEDDGAAYMDIREMLKADLSDKVDIVIRTGGAKRWSSPLINPNRIQTFHVENHTLVEEDNKPIENMATIDSLADFLSYCEVNHDADHKMVIFWNHGGASFGFGQDEIYNQIMSLKDMKKAFAKVYGDDPAEAPFEVIGFDACLMTAAESLNTFENYGKYLVGSEETEPGYGWYYTEWLNRLSENTAMNGAQLGLNIVNDYMDFYKAQDLKVSMIAGLNNVGLYVLDLKEAGKVYDEYEDLVKQVLIDTQEDPEALTYLSRAAHESIHYCAPYTELYNTVDLGTMMDNVAERYPDQAKEIKDTISKAVLYGRAENNMVGSSGISVFYPDATTSARCIYKMMRYINSVADDDALRALYFYKAAGCLTDDLKASIKDQGITNLENIDTEALKEAASADVEISGEGTFSLKLSDNARKYVQDYTFALGWITERGNILNLGEATDPVTIDDSGKLTAAFDGTWPCIEGQPLECEVIQKHNGIVTYQSSILLNGEAAYLVYSYDSEDDTFEIDGAYLKADQIQGDFVGRNKSEVIIGARITPVYECSDADGEDTETGETVKFTKDTKIRFEKLPDGTYCAATTFTDVRGDEFNSQTLDFSEKGGKISDTKVSETVVYLED